MRFALSRQLEDTFDSTDADKAREVAARALRLLRVCQRVLCASNAGQCISRDDTLDLAVKMREVAESMGLLGYYAAGAAARAFHTTLAIEAGLEPSLVGRTKE